MTEPTKLKSLKRSIPPDLQKQVEDIQKKVARTTGPPGDLDEEQKRWLIVGICLHSIISPLLRKYVDPIISNLYNSLVSSDSINTQGYQRYLKKYPATNRYYFNYESINNNSKLNKNYRNYDFKVKSHVDLSKLFLQTSMAQYSAIDDTCDLSALLGMVINISAFSPAAQDDTKKIRSDIRNPWAHCDFTEWTTAKYTDSFHLMEQFVKDIGLSNREENIILGELNTWATNGKLQTIIQKQDDDHIPKNIRAQHKQEISEWELDQTDFLVTRATLHILGSLPLNNCIVITGCSGCGKSSNIHHVALHLRDKYEFEIVPVLTGPSDIINYYDENNKQVFVVDDICGKETINIQKLQLWRDYSETMEKIFKTVENETCGTVSRVSGSKLLISCRLHIYKEAQFQLVKLLTEKECNILSPGLCLLQEERTLMVQKYLPNAIIEIVMEVEENVDFFPLLCKMSKNKTSEEVVKLFTAPVDSIMNNIRHIILENKTQFCALVVCILYDDGFNTDWLNLNLISEKRMNKLEDILREFEIDLSKEMARNALKAGFTTLVGTYLRKRGTEYWIIHDRILKMAAIICGQYLTECFIKYAPFIFIRDHFILESISTGVPTNPDCIILSEDKVDMYFERLLSDLKESIITSTFHNKQLIYQPFREKIIRIFGRSDESKQILKDFDPKGNKMKTDEFFLDWYNRLTTPLRESVSCGYYDLVHFLIDSVKCDVNTRDLRGRSLLYMASEGRNLNIVKLLLQNKTDMFNCETSGFCPLYVACAEGCTDIVNLFLQNNVYQYDSVRSSLMECLKGHTDTEQSYFASDMFRSNRESLHRGREFSYRDGEFPFHSHRSRDSPLYVACKRGHIDIAKILLQNNADVSLYNRLGETPLYTACEGGHTDIVKLLLQYNAAVSQLGINNKSSLHAAYNGGHTDIMELLLLNNDVSYDFNEFEIFLLLWEACEKAQTRLVELLLKKTDDINCWNTSEKRTLLHVVCSRGHASILILLLKNKAEISKCNSDGESPLYMACANGHTNIVNILLQNKADISQCKSDGESPLYVACKGGHIDIVNILLQNKADISQCKGNGESPFQAACANGHTDIVNILMQIMADVS